MTEKIGKVTLDYEFYPGVDLYCDGIVEQEILKIVQEHPAEEYDRIIEERAEWPILYHLSEKRGNIVEWIPMEPGAKVLEVGSGCGAITGTLAKKAESVTCIDLSKQRSTINAVRHQELDNIYIHVGNFKDVEQTLPCDYDYIFLIGVFEYGQGYMGSDTPYEDFMKILTKHLKTDGRLIIAIENQWGLKYWAGCREDHLGTYFSGLEGYQEDSGVRTFTRRGLEQIFKKTGTRFFNFYYPYPDYKFMTTLYSDKRLPNVGELSTNRRNFDRDRLQLFDEKNVFDSIIREDLFPLYSNSYLVVVGPELPNIYSKYSNDRAPEYAIRTDILEKGSSRREVEKLPLTEQAHTHIDSIYEAYLLLADRFQGSHVSLNECRRDGGKLAFEYLEGQTLEELLDEAMNHKDEELFLQLLKQYFEILKINEEATVTDRDLIFSNILVEGDRWNVIDYEWTVPEHVPAEFIFTRAIYCYLLGSSRRQLYIEKLGDRLAEFGYSRRLLDEVIEKELAFQRHVTGNGLSMGELRDKIDQAILYPTQQNMGKEQLVQLQIYEDTGNGFTEEGSYFVKNYGHDNVIEITLSYAPGTKAIRIDPCMQKCLVYVKTVELGGIPVQNLESMEKYNSRFSKIKCGYVGNGSKMGENLWVFDTTDPNFTIVWREGAVASTECRICMEVMPMPELLEQ